MPAIGRALRVVVVSATIMGACGGDPPDKEMQQAEGAIAAARAAGADQYAREEFTAAQEALKHAHEAVNDRDYRLALNHALDAREQAQDAAKAAADRKAVARVDADRAIRAAATSVDEARAKLKPVESSRAVARQATEVRRAIDDADQRLQEARAAFDKGDYVGVDNALKDVTPRLKAATDALTPAPATPARRRR